MIFKPILYLCIIFFFLKCGASNNSAPNNHIEYYNYENGDSSIHVKCIGSEFNDCWTYFKNGQLQYHVQYKENKLLNIFEVYDSTGRVLDFGSFNNGNGYTICYNQYGSIESSGIFVNGMRNGWWQTYAKDGKVIDSIHYINGFVKKYNLPYPNNNY